MKNIVLRILPLAAALSLATALPARAADSQPAMAIPQPGPELGQLGYFAGHWTCTGKAEASPFGPAHATQATVRIERDFGGFWNAGRYEEKKTAENPHPMTFGFYMGYDATANAWTLDGFDVFGNRSHETSSGWKDGVIAFAGTMTGGGPSTGS
ncbi:MAG TPA: hypothetical protein VN783_05925, partial [Thermoanaerobaculia bacterium]|nr:hypothetical protein [Thermoanaerobaculia bacterium]